MSRKPFDLKGANGGGPKYGISVMMPGAPLPKVSMIAKVLFTHGAPEVRWLGPGGDSVAHFYSHGRMALTEGVLAVMRSRKVDRAVLFVPDYICNEALESVRAMSVEIEFYPVGEDLSPDWQRLNERGVGEVPLRLFLLVHYFGFLNKTEEAITFCEANKMVLIEDCAHMLRPYASTGKGSLMVLSPRKLLPIPCGGVLVAHESFEKHLSTIHQSVSVVKIVQWIFLRMIQKGLVALGIPWKTFRKYREEKSISEEVARSETLRTSLCGQFTLRMLAEMGDDLEQISLRRRDNFSRIASSIAGVKGVRILFSLTDEETCPYMLPLILEQGAERLLRMFQEMGIPAGRWPLLPPEVLDSPDKHRIALWMREHLLLLPLHQSLTIQDADRIGKVLCGGLPS